MNKLQQLKREVSRIKNRNLKVETDKAWETSLFRKILIAVLTYIIIVLFFFINGLSKPFVNAIVPTLGFMLSTLTIPIFKKYWIRYIYREKRKK